MDDVGWLIVAIIVLAGLSVFFALNSLALRTFSRVKLQEAFKAAGRESRLERLVNQQEKFILTCGFFRVLCNIAIIILVLWLLKGRHYIIAFFVAVAALEIFNLAIPHSWAKYKGEYILSKTYALLGFFAILAWPGLAVFHLHDRLVRRLAGVTQADPEQAQDQRQEEILSVVEQGRMEGVVDEEEVEMIENVLELGDTTAEEIMTPRTDLVAVSIDDDLQTILDTITRAGHSRIPVYEKNIDNIIGFIYAKDLLTEIGKKAEDFNIKEKIRPAYFVPETKSLRDLLHEFQEQKLHISVVLDEYGGTAGIVTIEDILEELVGEIVDEYEKAPPEEMKVLDERTVEIDAGMYIDDINNEFGINLPEEEDYDTVGGFVFSHLGYIPKTGETFRYGDITFTITEAEARRIKHLKIQKPLENETTNK